MELQLPSGEDYLIEIRSQSEGGDGSSSGPIRIPKMSSKALIVLSLPCAREQYTYIWINALYTYRSDVLWYNI